MTPETRKTLLDLIAEYGNSLERIQGKKDLLKAIEACAVATAHWADKADKAATEREDLEAILDVFEVVRGGLEGDLK